MKKVFLLAGVAAVLCLGFGSCKSLYKTSTTLDVNTCLRAKTTADLVVSPTKITYSYSPTKSVKRAGNAAVKATAIAEALKANGKADVLVQPQFELTYKKGTIVNVVVTGYPATYTNFSVAPCK